MYDNFFTTYEITEPPPVPRKTYSRDFKHNIEKISLNDYSTVTSTDLPKISSKLDIQNPFVFQTERLPAIQNKEDTPLKESTNNILKGSKEFENAFEEACKVDPEVSKYKNFLVRTAKRESNFNSYIQNTTGAPYYGYFQMGKEEINRTTGLTIEQFRNNPVQQILGAVKLYKMNLKMIKALKVYDIGKDKGYTDDALVAGAWLGGPGGVKKYLLGLGDPSDSHWYKKAGQKGGSSVGKIMNDWMKQNNLK